MTESADEPDALVGELSDEAMIRILGVLGLEVAGLARDTADAMSCRRWHEVTNYAVLRRRDPWLARFTPGPARAAGPPAASPAPTPEPPHEEAPAFTYLSDLHEIGHRRVPKAPPVE